jgi:hypothetical protein
MLPEKLDLSDAVIVASRGDRLHVKAAEMLRDEVERRTGVRLGIGGVIPPDRVPAVVLGTVASLGGESLRTPGRLKLPRKAEGYAIWADGASRGAPTVHLVGRDDRGVLFAAGRLIRLLEMGERRVAISADVRLASAPRYSIRGHMMIPDGDFIEWDLAGFEQYIRDLVIFGTNSFEFTRPRPEVAKLLGEYGLDVWQFLGHGKPVELEGIEDVRRELGELEGLDAVFVPGGDSSGTPPPRTLIPGIERFAPLLKQVHSGARIWMSNQCGADHAAHDNEYVFGFLRTKRPNWLEGMVYGPWTRGSIADLRRQTPKRYKLRHYPDICHNLWCQYPVPKWDRAFARVWGRNGISVRPMQMARIHNAHAPATDGFIAYNHTGCNNDVNKFVWSAMAWDPDADLTDVLREYGKIFFGDEHAEAVAQGLLVLEDNWAGPIAENDGIEDTLAHWQAIARSHDDVSSNWRLELCLYRALIDAYIKRKHAAEAKCEADAYAALGRAREDGVAVAMEAARDALARVDADFPGKDTLRGELEECGLRRYGELGDVLDDLYRPLNDRRWLEAEFRDILDLDDQAEQLARIRRIVSWDDPGPGGFYDNLGVEGAQPHLVRQKTWREDPGFIESPVEFHKHSPSSRWRQSWLCCATTRYDTPLRMRYENLDRDAKYHLRVTYSGGFRPVMRLVANGRYEVHGPVGLPKPIAPLEFDLPQQATAGGVLELEWQLVNVVRGCQVAEVWLIRDA